MKTKTIQELVQDVNDIIVNDPIHVAQNFYLHVKPSLILNSINTNDN